MHFIFYTIYIYVHIVLYVLVMVVRVMVSPDGNCIALFTLVQLQ